MSLTACPDCAAPLTGAPTCPSCGLRLTGPDAVRLHQVDLRLASLAGEHAALLGERLRLLARLRPVGVFPFPQHPGAGETGKPAVRRETSPQSVQNTLLGLGALLLALAGTVFAAVTYAHLGVVGRALVLLALTTAAGAAPVWLLRRGLSSSAEAVGGVAVVLALLDAVALRRAGLLVDVAPLSWAAGASVVLTALGAAWALVVPLRTARLTTCVVGQLPALLLLARVDPNATTAALVLVALAAVDLLLADRAGLPADCRAVLAALGTTLGVVALLVSVQAVDQAEAAAGLGFVAVAALAAAVAVRRPDLREVLLATVVPLVATAAWVTVRGDLADTDEPLVGSLVVLLALAGIALLPAALRPGSVIGALAVAGVTVVAVSEPVLTAIAGPFTWLLHPWTLTGDRGRTALLEPWSGTAVVPVVLTAAAVAVVGGGWVLGRVREAVLPAGLLLAVASLVLPLGLDASYPVALALLLVVALGAFAGGLVRRELHLVGAAPAGLAAVWSLADETATLVVLPLVTAAAVAVAVREVAATAVAAVLAAATLCAYGASGGLRAEQVGLLLLVVPAACVGLSWVLRREHLEGVAVVLGLSAVVLTSTDDVLLTWSLALTGLLALAVAVRPDRRPVGYAGGLLLSASSWVRLAAADVHAPEPYVLPLALTALVLGVLRRRSTGCSSYEAYGSGLSLALVPTLLRSFADPTAVRGLLLLLVCTAVVLVGVQERLQAPLVIGGAVLAVDALHLLAPYASALPRWSLLATAGALLVTVGATYEQRLREVHRMRERYDSWA